MKFLIFLLFTPTVFASIFGVDNRIEAQLETSPEIQEIARSIPALVQRKFLEKLPNGDFKIIAKTMKERMKLCDSANFSSQFSLANCSAFLTKKNEVTTAGHCIDPKRAPYRLQDYYIVFDYALGVNPSDHIIPAENVYKPKKEVERLFNFPKMIDYTVIKLKRNVKNRNPLKLSSKKVTKGDPLFVIGFPLGVPQKFADDGFVTEIRESDHSFRHNLDTFSVNSGSAIFDANTREIVGIHVRGTGWNTHHYESQICKDWFRADPTKDYGEANFIQVVKRYY